MWALGLALRVDESTLAPTAGGYLAARVSECTEAEYAAPSGGFGSEDDVDDAVRVVSVVGLAHANGVLQRCASRALEDAEALTRTKALYDAGVLTEEEYNAKKNELLHAPAVVVCGPSTAVDGVCLYFPHVCCDVRPLPRWCHVCRHARLFPELYPSVACASPPFY